MFKRITAIGFLAATLANTAIAQNMYLGAYTAFIGPEDLRASNGTTLADARAVIAQDRANFHRFGIRHSDDQTDPYFDTRETRLTIPQLVEIDEAIASAILSGGTTVTVHMLGDDAGNVVAMRVELMG